MPDEGLTEDEGSMAAALAAGIWAVLKQDGEPIAHAVIDQLGEAKFHTGDDKSIDFCTPAVKENLKATLSALSDSMRQLTHYMFKHPGTHSVPQLGLATGVPDVFVETLLYKLWKLDLVEKVIAVVPAEPPSGSAGKLYARSRAISMYRITTAAWLREVQRRKEADAKEAADDTAAVPPC